MADEKGKETSYDSRGQAYTRETANYGGAGKSIAQAVAERQDRARSQLAAAAERAKKKTPMPTQMEGESPAAYGERLRRWRAGSE